VEYTTIDNVNLKQCDVFSCYSHARYIEMTVTKTSTHTKYHVYVINKIYSKSRT